MADPRRVVVSPCPHTRRVTAEPLCDACVLAAPTATIEECEWCVWINRGLPGAPPGTPTGPLARNAAMVSHAARMLRDGHDVRCLALLDGRKPAVVKPGEKRPTRGTEHTARLARDAGLTVDAQTWGSR